MTLIDEADQANGSGLGGDPPHPDAGLPDRGGQAHPIERIDEKIIYHDPYFLGRHNRMFIAPR